MIWPGYCRGCGVALPVPADKWQTQWKWRLIGSKCQECQTQHFPTWLGWLMGGLLGFGCGTGMMAWQHAISSPPPLPKLTTPTSSSSTIPHTSAGDKTLPESSQPEITYHLCGARTQNGKPCRRRVRGAVGYCWQHQKGPVPSPSRSNP